MGYIEPNWNTESLFQQQQQTRWQSEKKFIWERELDELLGDLGGRYRKSAIKMAIWLFLPEHLIQEEP